MIVDAALPGADAASGHGGGDDSLIRDFARDVSAGDAAEVLTGPRASLEGYLMAFATERSHFAHGTVINLE